MNKKEQEVEYKAYNRALSELRKGNIVIWPHDAPIAREYRPGDIYELVTEPDVSPSLAHMVQTGNVIDAGSGRFYQYDDLPEDEEEAHAMPDASLVPRMDVVIQDQIVEDLITNPENYEKSTELKEEGKKAISVPQGKEGKEGESQKAKDSGKES